MIVNEREKEGGGESQFHSQTVTHCLGPAAVRFVSEFLSRGGLSEDFCLRSNLTISTCKTELLHCSIFISVYHVFFTLCFCQENKQETNGVLSKPGREDPVI